MAEKDRVKAFRNEVDVLRNVIRKTINDILAERSEKFFVRGVVDTGRVKVDSLEKRISLLENRVKKEDEHLRKTVEGEIRNITEGEGMDKIVKGGIETGIERVNNKILMVKREMEMLRQEMESSSVKRLENELHINIGNLRSEVKKVIVDGKGLEERLISEIEDIRKGMADLGKAGEQFSGMDMENLKRDLEIIKTKQEWIENNIERIDIKPLLRKMEELEHRIRVIGISSPVIVE